MQPKQLHDLQIGDYVAIPNRSMAYDSGPRVEYAIYQVVRRSKIRLHVKHVSGKRWYGEMAIDTRCGRLLDWSDYYAKVATPNLLHDHEQQIAKKAEWDAAFARTGEIRRKGIERMSAAQLHALADAWEKVKDLP